MPDGHGGAVRPTTISIGEFTLVAPVNLSPINVTLPSVERPFPLEAPTLAPRAIEGRTDECRTLYMRGGRQLSIVCPTYGGRYMVLCLTNSREGAGV